MKHLISEYGVTKTQLQLALKSLQFLKRKIKEEEDDCMSIGICNNYYSIKSVNVKNMLKDNEILSEWKYYSGDYIFPIKSTIKGLDNVKSYQMDSMNGTLWKGKGYWYRIRLLNYWIKVLKELLNIIN